MFLLSIASSRRKHASIIIIVVFAVALGSRGSSLVELLYYMPFICVYMFYALYGFAVERFKSPKARYCYFHVAPAG